MVSNHKMLSGADLARTGDFNLAKVALSQLSYSPKISSKSDTDFLSRNKYNADILTY